MLIVALVLAVIGLAALVTAVVTSNELVAWVCIAASVLGVILLIVDAIRERQQRTRGFRIGGGRRRTRHVRRDRLLRRRDELRRGLPEAVAEEQHPDEVVSDEAESDTPSDDEPQVPAPAGGRRPPGGGGRRGEGTEDSAENPPRNPPRKPPRNPPESTDESGKR